MKLIVSVTRRQESGYNIVFSENLLLSTKRQGVVTNISLALSVQLSS